MKLAKFDLNYKIKVSSRIHNYLSPDYVYIPLNSKSKIFKKNNDNVSKGEVIVENDTLLYSSISGKIAGAKKFGNKIYLTIENNFKEKQNTRIINHANKKLDKDEIIKIFKKFDIQFNHSIESILLVKVIDEEPYIVNNSFYFQKNTHDMLETLDYIKEKFDFSRVIILAKNTDSDLLSKLNNVIGTYPDFSLITLPNRYLISSKENYKNFIDCKIEEIMELDIFDLQKIFNALYKNRNITEKYITITGDVIENPLVINAKIGALLSDIINDSIKFKDTNNLSFYVNGLLRGKKMDINDVLVSEDLDGVLITKDADLKEEKCIRCGLCNDYCPMNYNPLEKYLNKDSLNCLKCGLCSYICPSNINFKNLYNKEDHNE